MIEASTSERQTGFEVAHRSFLFIARIGDAVPDSTRIPYGSSEVGLKRVVLGVAFEAGSAVTFRA